MPKGLFATCIQHEIDHLNGVLFMDLSVEAEARPRAEEVCQGREARRSNVRSCSDSSVPGRSAVTTRHRSTLRKGTICMPLRLIFMGTPDFAVPTLLELVAAWP